VVIDSCVTCDLIWLDFGELRQITDAAGRDRGRPASVLHLFDKGDRDLGSDV
jgi:Zn-finger nucleic acid-binding protein